MKIMKMKKITAVAMTVALGLASVCATSCAKQENIVQDGKTVNVRINKSGWSDEYFTAWKNAFENLYAEEGYKIELKISPDMMYGNQPQLEIGKGAERNDVDLYIYDSVGTRIGYNTYCGNDEGCTVTLEAAGVYTVKVSQRRGLCSYNLNLGMQKAVQDISSYDKIVDSIDFDDQEIYYSFTPTESGLYRFTFSEMMADLDVNIYVYNYLGEQVYYNTWCGNGDGVTATNLNAAETYIICVTEKNGTGFTISGSKKS